MAGKNRSFLASQNAHERLRKKYEVKMGKTQLSSVEHDKAFIKRQYHAFCSNKQKELGRVLSRSEKRSAYDYVIQTFF